MFGMIMSIIMMAITLVTVIVTPNFCQSPCSINYLTHIEYPEVRGEMCIHLALDGSSMNDEITKNCQEIDKESSRYHRGSFKNVGAGRYVLWVTINDKMVSNKPGVTVGSGIQESKFK